MTIADRFPVCGIAAMGPAEATFPAASSASIDAQDLPADSFRQLVSLHQSNEILFRELASVKDKRRQAESYLAAPGCNAFLGEAHLGRLRIRHSAVLTLLRANRIQARALLSRVSDAPASE